MLEAAEVVEERVVVDIVGTVVREVLRLMAVVVEAVQVELLEEVAFPEDCHPEDQHWDVGLAARALVDRLCREETVVKVPKVPLLQDAGRCWVCGVTLIPDGSVGLCRTFGGERKPGSTAGRPSVAVLSSWVTSMLSCVGVVRCCVCITCWRKICREII